MHSIIEARSGSQRCSSSGSSSTQPVSWFTLWQPESRSLDHHHFLPTYKLVGVYWCTLINYLSCSGKDIFPLFTIPLVTHLVARRIPPLAYEGILFVLLLVKFYQMSRDTRMSSASLVVVFVRDGAWAFGVVSCEFRPPLHRCSLIHRRYPRYRRFILVYCGHSNKSRKVEHCHNVCPQSPVPRDHTSLLRYFIQLAFRLYRNTGEYSPPVDYAHLNC